MEEVLIISRMQFGYNTDRYKWCEYLRNKYKVTHLAICSKEKYELSGVKQINISSSFPRTIRGILLFLIAIGRIIFLHGTVIVAYFPHCEILQKVFPRKRMILDVRTMSVQTDPVVRERENNAIQKAASVFYKVTAISQGVADQLKVIKKVDIIPLGADLIQTNNKIFDKLNLLYIGTLFNRNIEITLRGFALAKSGLPEEVELTYDIVGDGPNGEKQELEKLAGVLGLEDSVRFHGYVPHSKLDNFLEKCNIGVSFVPITPYYEYQPVTKTFEYALAGLYVMATDTYSNRDIVTSYNGLLIRDDEQSFSDGIITIYNNRKNINSDIIRESLIDYSWKKIVEERLIPIIESLKK